MFEELGIMREEIFYEEEFQFCGDSIGLEIAMAMSN